MEQEIPEPQKGIPTGKLPSMATLPNSSPITTSARRRIYHLHVQLLHIEPAVWRTLWVPETVKLKKLDRIIQEYLGWTNSHAHAFTINGKQYGPAPQNGWDCDIRMLDEKRFALHDLLGNTAGFEFSYQYDFGDDWQHRLVVERITAATPHNNWPLCIAGANACPPEDVGGPAGYGLFREVMANPHHPDFEHYWGWIGGPFDSTAFDINLTNRRIRNLR